MKITISDLSIPASGGLAVGVLEGRILTATGQKVDTATGGALSRAIGSGRFKGARGEILEIHAPVGLEVTPLLAVGLGKPGDLTDLGMEAVGGAVAKLIMNNSQIPARATEMFSTSVDGQTSIKIHVLQGEREMVSDCRSLGEFHLRGIPPMPAGIPQLEVEFLVDANGVLSVSAVEKRSGKRAVLQIVPNHGLTRDEVERIEQESFAHAREDMAHHRIVDLIANSKLDRKWIGERLEKIAPKLETDYRAQLDQHISALRILIEKAESDWQSVDPDKFHRTKESLDHASIRMHEISIAQSLREDQARL